MSKATSVLESEVSVLRHFCPINHSILGLWFILKARQNLFNMSTTDSKNGSAKSRYSLLKHRTQAFCAAFLDLANNPPEKILNEHFGADEPKITEHGPEWANKRLPFLGKTFTGRDEFLKYFQLLAETLEFIPNEHTFPGPDGIIVDEHARVGAEGKAEVGVVSVVGQAKFKAVKTGESWEEQFIYRLSWFDGDGKIGHWEIWADPLSAWMAVGGGEKGS